MLVMLGEGGETRYDTNINFFLEELGIMVNNGQCQELRCNFYVGYAFKNKAAFTLISY